MVVTKLAKRKRKQPDWLGNNAYPIFDLTEDGNESGSASFSDLNSSDDGKRSPAKAMDSLSFDQEILLADEEEDTLQFPSPAKNLPVAMDTCVGVYSQPDIELENHVESQIVLPVESIQPPIKTNGLYMIFSAQAVEVRGGDKESMIHEWPLENIVRIGIHYLSEEEEDTRAFVAISVLVPFCSLSRASNIYSPEIDEYLLQLSKFRDSVVGISKLSPIFGGIIEELKKEDVEKTARTIKMQNSQTSNSLFSLSSEEFNKAVDAFKVLIYPQDDPDAVTITQKDIKILEPFEFLNDTIIDFYIKYLQQTCVSSEKLETLHFFNSFFFSKLAEVGGKAAFERVKKWTRKVDVFEKDFVFIPVNHSLHWSLIIICHPGNIWEVPTATDGSFDGDACILHLDSMEGSHRGVDSHIRNYLFQEWIERNRDPREAPYVGEFFFGMPYIYLKVPQQDNNCDCGLFLLHYVELFLKQAPSVYRMRRQRNPPTEFLRRNWFKPSEASAKRRVIQSLILELSQGSSLDGAGEHTNVRVSSPDGADEQLTRASSVSLDGEKQHSAQPIDELDSNQLYQAKEPPFENCRSEAVDVHVDLNPDKQDEHVKLRLVDGRTEASECDDIRRGVDHDQPNASSKSGADQSGAHISAESNDLNSGPDPVVHETWNHERCPVPRLSLQVKPLRVPTLHDEEVQMLSQPPAVGGIQNAPESSDELSSSYFGEDARRSLDERRILNFDNILSPKQANTAGSDDEMYESSPCGAKPRWSTSKVQHEVVSPVVRTPENVPSSRVRSPELREEGLTRRQAKFRNSTPPFGRCSMQSTLNFGHRKDKDQTQWDSHQQYGSFQEVQEIEELSSDDSDSSDFEKMPVAKKRPSIETVQRVTRSKTQISHGLTLSTEKQAKKDALDALRRKKGSRRR